MKAVEKVVEVLDTDKTAHLFEVSIKKANALDAAPYTEDSLRAARMNINYGNLHVNTAKTKLSAIRLVGYQNSLSTTKKAVERKIRNQRKYGGK